MCGAGWFTTMPMAPSAEWAQNVDQRAIETLVAHTRHGDEHLTVQELARNREVMRTCGQPSLGQPTSQRPVWKRASRILAPQAGAKPASARLGAGASREFAQAALYLPQPSAIAQNHDHEPPPPASVRPARLRRVAGGAAPFSAQGQDQNAQVRLLAGPVRDGIVQAGLEIVLHPRRKTYWRYPGDSGVPPRFNWSGSTNVADVSVLWPAPHAF